MTNKRSSMKIIGEHPGYSITSCGRVFGPRGERKLVPDRAGYLTVVLKKPLKCYKIHRLVAEAFIPNGDLLPEVDHIDEDKTNNSVENLRWSTRQANAEHSLALKTTLRSPTGERWEVFNYATFSKAHNINQGAISRLVNGVYKQTGGWTLYDS